MNEQNNTNTQSSENCKFLRAANSVGMCVNWLSRRPATFETIKTHTQATLISVKMNRIIQLNLWEDQLLLGHMWDCLYQWKQPLKSEARISRENKQSS